MITPFTYYQVVPPASSYNLGTIARQQALPQSVEVLPNKLINSQQASCTPTDIEPFCDLSEPEDHDYSGLNSQIEMLPANLYKVYEEELNKLNVIK